MIGQLKITFAPDMPAVAVDVVSPDLEVVERMMMAPGQSRTVSVPSEASFLSVHLPSGRTAVLHDPGNLDRVVTRDALTAVSRRSPNTASVTPNLDDEQHRLPSAPPTRRDLHRHHLWRAANTIAPDLQDQNLPLGSHGVARLSLFGGHWLTGEATNQAREAEWNVPGPPFQPPLELRIEQKDSATLIVKIPGNARRVWARADHLVREKAVTYSIRVQTTEPVADTILNYLRRGDVAAARTMEEWAEKSEELLADKMSDPYGASVGGYLLLRLQRPDLLHSWPRTLADAASFLPDGCIIWASQLRQNPDASHDITDYLLKAVDRGLPVYTSGLRLLLDGLRVLGSEGIAAYKKVVSQAGSIIWESPITAGVIASRQTRTSDYAITYDIGFGASA
jgi:hypothetical protein